MKEAGFFNDILILLLAAVAVVSLFQRFRASPILGYLVAGVTIGPYVLGFVKDVETTKIIGQFGVVFLLFTIGLKMPLQRLQILKRYVFGLGFAQVLLTGCIIFIGAVMLGVSPEAALIISSILALSSTAVSIQVLVERGEIILKFGRVSFAILLFQDLAVVVFLVLLTTIGRSDVSLLQEVTLAILKAFVVLVGIVLMGRLLLRPLYRGIAKLRNPDLFIAVTLLIILSISLATSEFGLSMELGAFLAGLLLSETEYRHQVEADIQPFYGLFLGLFFMTIGMGINVQLVADQLWLILAVMLGMLTIKSLILYALCRVFKVSSWSSLRISLLLAPGGEFAFVLLGPAIQNELLTSRAGQIIYAAVAISMALTPFLAMIGKKIGDRWLDHQSEKSLKVELEEIGDLKNHVIIAGYGRVGRMIVKVLTEKMIPFVAIDQDMKKVTEGRAQGLPVFYGDARRAVVMRALGGDRAQAAVISLSDERAAAQVTLMLRRQFPHIRVSTRLRDEKYQDKLLQTGAVVVMPETLEPSLQLASSALRAMGTPTDEIHQVIENYRRSYKPENKYIIPVELD